MRTVLAILLLSCWVAAAKAQAPVLLDQLDPTLIPIEERFAGQPKELVAVLGSGRGRHWAPLTCLAYSPDGKYVACGSNDGKLCLWDATTMREVAVFRGHTGAVFAVAFSPNSQVLASASHHNLPKPDGQYKGEVKMWDVPTGKLRATLGGHIGLVLALAYSQDGQLLASAGEDKTIRLWDLTKSPTRLHAQLRGHQKPVTAVAFTPNGNMVVSGDQAGEFRSWEVLTAKNIDTRTLPGGKVLSLAFSRDGKNLLACSSEKVEFFDWQGGKPAERLELKHSNRLVYMALSRDSKRLATVDDVANVHLWDLTRQKPLEVGSIECPSRGLPAELYSHKVAFAPDGKTLSVISDGSVIGDGSHVTSQWDVSGALPKELLCGQGPQGPVVLVAWTADGRQVIAASSDNTGWVWDWQVKQFGQGNGWSLEGNRWGVEPLAVTADAHTLATASRGGFQLWDLRIRPPRAGLRMSRDSESLLSALAFAPNGKMLARGSYYDQPIRLVNLAAKKPKEQILVETKFHMPRVLVFSPDGRSLAVCGDGGGPLMMALRNTVRVYEVATCQERWSITRVITWASSLSFAPDGKTLAISWNNGRVTLVEVASANPSY